MRVGSAHPLKKRLCLLFIRRSKKNTSALLHQGARWQLRVAKL
jgi:hypothetical protein